MKFGHVVETIIANMYIKTQNKLLISLKDIVKLSS